MSTFVFAPSWVTYPNQPKPVKKQEEFPTLSSNSNTTQNTTNNNNNTVWSTPHLIKKIQDNDEDDEYLEEQRYELERLKALVPKTSNNNHKKPLKPNASMNTRKMKTKRPLSTPSSSFSRSNSRPSKMIPTTATTTNHIAAITTHTTPVTSTATTTTSSSSSTTTTTTTKSTGSSITKVDEVSLEEQEHFLHFIQYWTSNSTGDDDEPFPEYTYFKSTSNNNIKPTNIKALTDNSYFYNNPFNKNP